MTERGVTTWPASVQDHWLRERAQKVCADCRWQHLGAVLTQGMTRAEAERARDRAIAAGWCVSVSHGPPVFRLPCSAHRSEVRGSFHPNWRARVMRFFSDLGAGT